MKACWLIDSWLVGTYLDTYTVYRLVGTVPYNNTRETKVYVETEIKLSEFTTEISILDRSLFELVGI